MSYYQGRNLWYYGWGGGWGGGGELVLPDQKSLVSGGGRENFSDIPFFNNFRTNVP